MTALRNVMFVDDEPLVLTGLRNGLRKHRKRWNMVFAGGGPAAREEYAKLDFDVVVSDMRMPEVDGATLLAELRARAPRTIRVVLSGYAERSAVMRARAVSHQMFDKPCNLDQLALAIDRGCALRDLFATPELVAARARLAPLPDRPRGYPWIAPGLDDPPGVLEMTSSLAADAQLVDAILELGRGLCCGPGQPPAKLADLARLWGPFVVSTFALLARALSACSDPARVAAVRETTLAVTAQLVATVPKPLLAEAMCVGLLHDVGGLLSHRCAGVSEPSLAALMLEDWGMSLQILDGIAFWASDDPALPSSIRPAIRAARANLIALGA